MNQLFGRTMKLRARYISFILALLTVLLTVSCQIGGEEEASSYVVGLEQMKAEILTDSGFNGMGVKVGIVDIGFLGADKNPDIQHIFTDGRLYYKRDYTGRDSALFFRGAESHGTSVMSLICGRISQDKKFKGSLGSQASIYLALVGKAAIKEQKLKDEEAKTVKAFEDLYHAGVRVVNLSMGYWDEFKNPDENYTPEQMDGNTTLIARACSHLSRKGMIFVAAAGNTAEYAWRIVWSPGDAENVVTVGAISHTDCLFRAGYSAVGNPAVNFVKPDVVVYSKWGTSFSTPLITGLVAAMLQKDSTLSPRQIQRLLHKASTIYPYPNNYVGYGLPDATKIMKLMNDSSLNLSTVEIIHTSSKEAVLPPSLKKVVIFYKVNDYVVKRQERLDPGPDEIVIKRKKDISRITVVYGFDKAFELFWDDK